MRRSSRRVADDHNHNPAKTACAPPIYKPHNDRSPAPLAAWRRPHNPRRGRRSPQPSPLPPRKPPRLVEKHSHSQHGQASIAVAAAILGGAAATRTPPSIERLRRLQTLPMPSIRRGKSCETVTTTARPHRRRGAKRGRNPIPHNRQALEDGKPHSRLTTTNQHRNARHRGDRTQTKLEFQISPCVCQADLDKTRTVFSVLGMFCRWRRIINLI